MKNLFIKGKFKLSSLKESDFKIECDALTSEDWETLAKIIANKLSFSEIYSVPTGGDKLAEALSHYVKDFGPVLIVDDVLTTGKSMVGLKKELVYSGYIRNRVIGVVIFARGKCPKWVTPVFQINKKFI